MKKIISTAVALAIIASIFVTPVCAYNVSLCVPGEEQTETQWCWAATSVAVAYYRNKSYFDAPGYTSLFVTQRNHVYVAQGSYDNVTRDMYDNANSEDVQTDFGRLYGIYPSAVDRYFRVDEVQSHMSSGKPLYIRIGWPLGGGHAV